MATDLLNNRRGGETSDVAVIWNELQEAYECRVLVCPEDEGGYSAHAIRLPGVSSQGETVEEALANVAEAFAATVRLYLDERSSIPWESWHERPQGAFERWIRVNV